MCVKIPGTLSKSGHHFFKARYLALITSLAGINPLQAGSTLKPEDHSYTHPNSMSSSKSSSLLTLQHS
jgi:hypothetical protein